MRLVKAGMLAAGLLVWQFGAMAKDGTVDKDQAKVDLNYDVFATIDKNNDQLLSDTEFDAYWAKPPAKQPAAAAKPAKSAKGKFKQIDKNANGVIEEEEYVFFFVELPDDELKAKIAEAKAKKAKEKSSKQ